MREHRDIKAPDGFLLGGERVVRPDGTVLFQRGWWKLPDGFAEPGEYVWVHCTDSGAGDLEVAPPGYHSFYSAVSDHATVMCPRTKRSDAKAGFRNPASKAWAEQVSA